MIFSRFQRAAAALLLAPAVSATQFSHAAEEVAPVPVLRSPSTTQAVAYQFTADESALLEAVQRGCFNYLWNEVGQPALLARDRRGGEVASVAGVGFQLSALPIGVERGWITRDEGEARARHVLRTLRARTDIRRDGVYLHFVDADDAAVYPPFNNEASTVDHALLLAGAMPAATYFGGETAELVRQIAADTNWRPFAREPDGFLSMGWRPADNVTVSGPGELLEHGWHLATDEERLIYFLAVGAPTSGFALDPAVYYRLARHMKRHADMPPFVVSWNGSLFTYFFSHSWIDYRSLGADDPSRFGVDAPRVDWFENSRRAVLTHRRRCLEAAAEFPTFAEDRWGVSPCMGYDAQDQHNYLVQDVEPNLTNHDEWHQGTIAPYAAGSAIVFTPQESAAALRAYRELKDDKGEPLVWRDPAAGGYALADSFRLPQKAGDGAAGPRVSDDNLAIDVGPMLLAIENARTGLIWRLFMQHPDAQRAAQRLRLTPLEE
jgi:hypothetical protein